MIQTRGCWGLELTKLGKSSGTLAHIYGITGDVHSVGTQETPRSLRDLAAYRYVFWREDLPDSDKTQNVLGR